MISESHASEILDREKELLRLNERINNGSPKLFNKNEKYAITSKKIDKDVWKSPEKPIKPKPVNASTDSHNTPVCSKLSLLEAVTPKKTDNRTDSNTSTPITMKVTDAAKFPTKGDETGNVIPKSFERAHVNKDNLIKFLKAKVAILQNELESAVTENKEQNESIKELTKKLERADLAYNNLNLNHQSLQLSLKKLDEKNSELKDVIKDKDERIHVISKEQARVSLEWSKMKKQNQTLETRLHQLRETHEATKQKLAMLSETTKDIRMTKNHERVTLENQIKELKRDRMQMLNAFKKQLLQTDQLKKQTNCFDEEKLIEIAEKEYLQLLEWSKKSEEES